MPTNRGGASSNEHKQHRRSFYLGVREGGIVCGEESALFASLERKAVQQSGGRVMYITFHSPSWQTSFRWLTTFTA